MTVLKRAWRGGSPVHHEPGWWLEFAYDEDLVAALKRTIPARSRAWDPDAKCWWVSVEYDELLCDPVPGFEAFLRQPQLL